MASRAAPSGIALDIRRKVRAKFTLRITKDLVNNISLYFKFKRVTGDCVMAFNLVPMAQFSLPF
jgi:hypothetical protein